MRPLVFMVSMCVCASDMCFVVQPSSTARYVAALASFAIGLVPRELLQTAATADDDERQDYDARQLLGEIVVKLVRLWMEGKGTEFGAAVWEALDDIALTWRHRNPTGSSGVATVCMCELFEALRGQVYPAIIVSLLSGDRPELLTEFLQVRSPLAAHTSLLHTMSHPVCGLLCRSSSEGRLARQSCCATFCPTCCQCCFCSAEAQSWARWPPFWSIATRPTVRVLRSMLPRTLVAAA